MPAGLLYLAALSIAFAQPSRPDDPYASITSAIEQGRFAEAETALRSMLHASPDELRALSLLGVVLDSQQRYGEAEETYLRAIRLAPGSAALLNNLGNHYLVRGDPEKARQAFEKVLAREPRHANANLQMAQLALEKKGYALSLLCLDRLPETERQAFPVRLLHLRALWGTGQKTQADSLLRALENEASSDIRYRFALAMALVAMERFAEAEEFFTVVLKADPANFDVLYNLAMAALRAGHPERAAEVFQRALQVRPDDVDSTVGLARALMLLRSGAKALPVLVRAHQMAPSRPDILLLMAQSTYDEGYYADTAIAYEQYLKLRPDDDVARRERGFALTRSFRVKDGLADLEWYVKKHPQDPWGHFKLAAAQSLEDKEQALESINKALALDPGFQEALYARGVLLLQLNRAAEAVTDLKAYLKVDPENGQALDQMGRAMLKAGEPAVAVGYLQKAIEKSPENGNLYYQLSRALRALGRTREMTEALARFKQLGGVNEKAVPQPGLFDFLSLPPEEQQARSITLLRRAVEQRPSDPELRIALAEILFRKNETSEALVLIEQACQISQDIKILTRAAKVLLNFDQHAGALPLLEAALRQGDVSEDISLDYVLAQFHTAGAEAALARLDQIGTDKRSGNYFLLRAQLLDALDRFPEAVSALNEALRSAPDRPDLYLQATQFLVKHNRHKEALDLLAQAERYVPDSRDLLMTRAIIMEMLNHPDDAIRELSRIESLWPEWHLPYLTHGIILQIGGKPEEARQLLETAIALGARDPAGFYYLSQAIKNLSPGENDRAYQVVLDGLKLSPTDPYLLTQAGRLALAMKDYPKARAHLEEAIRIEPEMADAHWTMAGLFRATGEKEKQLKALAEVERLNKLYPQGKDAGRQMRDLLFSGGLSGGRRTSGQR
ncbi:MAG: tetratricopeptide repeat protein [Acidobacteria bacterium]|nr:tetratricopeptide repeat protein [Acidobacteriota bacterium]